MYSCVAVYNKDARWGVRYISFLLMTPVIAPGLGFTYPPLITCDWVNGLPDEDAVYDATGNLVSKTKYYYNYTSVASRPADPNEKKVTGVKVDLGILPLYCADSESLTMAQFVEGQFDLISSWHHITKKEESLWNIEGSVTTTTTDYFYDDPAHVQKTAEQVTDSKGLVHRTQFTYPLDYDASVMNGVIGSLNNANLVTPVVSTIEAIDNVVTGGVVNELNAVGNPVAVYQLETSKPLPDFLEPSKNSNGLFTNYLIDTRYKRRAKFLYNSSQDVIEISNDYGDVTAYLWGYKGSYPIAEIKNATYSQISSTLGTTLLNDLYLNVNTDADIRSKLSLLRSATSLSAARSTVLTYHPSGAISSLTDPNGRTQFFFFDSANRLESIKDHNQNILSAFKYHYKN